MTDKLVTFTQGSVVTIISLKLVTGISIMDIGYVNYICIMYIKKYLYNIFECVLQFDIFSMFLFIITNCQGY